MQAYRVSVCVPQSQADLVMKLAGGTYKEHRRKKQKDTHEYLIDCSYMTAAVSTKNAMLQGLERGWSVTDVVEVIRHSWQREVVSKEYKLAFLRALSFYCESMSPSISLMTVIRAESHTGTRHELDAAMRILDAGGQFSDALHQISFFDVSILSILIAGEKTGGMKQAISSAVEHYEQGTKTRAIMFGLLTAMSIDLFVTVSGAISVQMTFLPWLEKQAGDTSNKETFLAHMQIGYWLNGVALVSAVVIGAAIAVAIFQGLIPPNWPGKKFIEDMSRKVPLFSKYFINQEVSDTFKVASVMLGGGVTLDKTVLVTENASRTHALRSYWMGVGKRILRGDSMVAAVANDPLVRDGEHQMIAAHQSSAQLGVIMGKISEARGLEAQKNAKTISSVMVLGTICYGVYTALIMIWLLLEQNSVLTGVMNMARGK